jgi:cathepsin L
MESAAAINDKKQAAILAPQQFVDCTPNPNHCGGTGGCEGATAELAYQYLAGTDGLTQEKWYHYTGRDGQCKSTSPEMPATVSISGYGNVQSNNFTSMMMGLVNNGPLVIAVAADAW